MKYILSTVNLPVGTEPYDEYELDKEFENHGSMMHFVRSEYPNFTSLVVIVLAGASEREE